MSRISLLLSIALAAAGGPVAIERLGWMSGCWDSAGGETGSGEQWSLPAGGTMLGMSRYVHDGKTVSHEFVRISETADGSLVFVAAPSGQASHAFPLARISAHEVVFEDPQHDFPQRIVYRLLAPDRLLGRIEGERNGQLHGVDFPLIRGHCGE